MDMRKQYHRSAVVALTLLIAVCTGCAPKPDTKTPRLALFVGVDTSGSFRASGHYEDSLAFLAHYIYGHVNNLGGLAVPRELFVSSIGGRSQDEPKSFHPIHDFTGKTVEEIEASLREWFPPTDTLTDFNAFFKEVARISKDRNLVLAPISIVVLSDGVPDSGGGKGSRGQSAYAAIDLSDLEYLSRNLTIRLTYANPKVGEQWRQAVPRQRVRMWTVDGEVMKGWRYQLTDGVTLPEQERFWGWVRDTVDYRVRSRTI